MPTEKIKELEQRIKDLEAQIGRLNYHMRFGPSWQYIPREPCHPSYITYGEGGGTQI